MTPILILGSTGRTGRWLLREALNQGFQVSVLVRDRRKLNEKHPHLVVVEGNPGNKADLERAYAGCGAVLSALNISRTSDFPWAGLRTPPQLLSEVATHLIDLKVPRVVVTSAWGTNETRGDIPFWFRWLIDNSNVGAGYRDHERQERIWQQNGDLNWTVVRPVGLTNSRQSHALQVTLTGNQPRPSLTVSRRDVALFMLECLKNDTYIRQMPIISNQ